MVIKSPGKIRSGFACSLGLTARMADPSTPYRFRYVTRLSFGCTVTTIKLLAAAMSVAVGLGVRVGGMGVGDGPGVPVSVGLSVGAGPSSLNGLGLAS